MQRGPWTRRGCTSKPWSRLMSCSPLSSGATTAKTPSGTLPLASISYIIVVCCQAACICPTCRSFVELEKSRAFRDALYVLLSMHHFPCRTSRSNGWPVELLAPGYAAMGTTSTACVSMRRRSACTRSCGSSPGLRRSPAWRQRWWCLFLQRLLARVPSGRVRVNMRALHASVNEMLIDRIALKHNIGTTEWGAESLVFACRNVRLWLLSRQS